MTARSITPKYFLLCLPLVLLWSCAKPDSSQTENSQGEFAFKTPFQDESEFIVQTIVTALGELAEYAGSGNLESVRGIKVTTSEKPDSERGKLAYEISVKSRQQNPGIHVVLVINQPIWEPALYLDLARLLIKQVKQDRTNTATVANPTLLTSLTDLSPEKIEKQNQQVSSWLKDDIFSPRLHEQAALLLGAFALREYSGDYYDVRYPLCLMTAHLAFAKSLSAPSSLTPEGQVAEAILYALMNNQKTALEKVLALPDDKEMLAWKRALFARITGDYRPLAAVKDQTLLERILYLDARSRSLSIDEAWEEIQSKKWPVKSDFCRIANSSSYSVGLGHYLQETSLAMEMQESIKIMTLSLGRELTPNNWIKELNRLPVTCFDPTQPPTAKLRVIGSGQWAIFLQRHLCHTLQHNYDFLQRKWGVPDAAKEYSDVINQELAQLRLFPFVQRKNCTTVEELKKSSDACGRVICETPQLLSPRLWNYFWDKVSFSEPYIPGGIPDVCQWHKHNPPPGTAYHPRPRFNHASLSRQIDTEKRFDQLLAMAPYDLNVISGWLMIKAKGQGANAVFESVQEAYRPVREYSVTALLELAKRTTNSPAKYEQFMSEAAAHNANCYFGLGRYFADRNDTNKAVLYYEKGVNLCSDEVLVANQCDWLVWHYYSTGKTNEAEALADRAAEVYSYNGLKVKGDLLFAQGNFPKSLDYYLKIEERYNRPDAVVAWCRDYKARTGDQQYDREITKRLTTLFPRGIEKVSPPSFRGPATAGVVVMEENELVRAAGLKTGDVIVALNGDRVYDLDQYCYLRDQSKVPEMHFIFWNGREYKETKASPPQHRFKVVFSTYPPASR